MQDILKRDSMAFPASLLATEIDIDRANALDRNLAVIGNGKNVGFERSICLEDNMVNSDVDVRRGAEDPVVARIAVVDGSLVEIGLYWDT